MVTGFPLKCMCAQILIQNQESLGKQNAITSDRKLGKESLKPDGSEVHCHCPWIWALKAFILSATF
jgi:hypothetical protein